MALNLDHLTAMPVAPQPQVMIGVDPTLSNVINGQALLALAATLYVRDDTLTPKGAALAALQFQDTYNEVAVEWDAAKKVAAEASAL